MAKRSGWSDAGNLLQVTDAASFASAFGVSRESRIAFETYEQLLRRWQAVQDLVAPSTVDAVWQRHFADSAQLLALSPDAKTWLDLGSGAGFPGLVIAILLRERPGARVHLVESNMRKCAFLADVARATDAPVEIHQNRLESLIIPPEFRSFEVVTARALAPLGKLIGFAKPFFSAGTVGYFLKGRDAPLEVEAAMKVWRFTSTLIPSRTDGDARIVEVTKIEALKEGFP